MGFKGYSRDALASLDFDEWLSRFRVDVLGIQPQAQSLEIGDFVYDRNSELAALFLNYIAEQTQLFDTFDTYKKRFRQSAIPPRKPDRDPEKSRLRSSRTVFIKESVDYHIRDARYQQQLRNSESEQDALDHFKANYSPDAIGYAQAILDHLTPIQRRFFSESHPFQVMENRRRRHSYVCGGTGSGKSEMLKRLTHHYLSRDSSAAVVVIDPHGELTYQIAKFAENETNERLVLIDPSLSRSDGVTPVFNPFELSDNPSPEDLGIYTEELMAAFRATMDDEAGFSMQMEVVLKPCIAALLLMPDGHIGHLQQFMDDDENAQLKDFAIRHLPNSQQVQFVRRQIDKSNYAITKQSIYTKVQSFLNSQVFLNFLVGKSTLDLESEINQRKLIVFNLSRSSAGAETSSAMGRLILARLIGIAMQRAALSEHDRESQVPIHLFIDEAQHYVTPTVGQILTETRKYKLYLTLANQFLDQINDRQVRTAVEGNTEIKLVGRQTDPRGVNTLSKIAGVDPSSLTQLPVGSFLAKIGELPGFTIQNRQDLLEFRHSMPHESWDALKQEQISRYYQPIKSTEEMGRLLDSRLTLTSSKPAGFKQPKRTLE